MSTTKSINYARKIAEMSAKKSINYAINRLFSWETNIQSGESHMFFFKEIRRNYKEKTCRDVDGKSINYARKIAEMLAKQPINSAINRWFARETNIKFEENHMLFEMKLAEITKKKLTEMSAENPINYARKIAAMSAKNSINFAINIELRI